MRSRLIWAGGAVILILALLLKPVVLGRPLPLRFQPEDIVPKSASLFVEFREPALAWGFTKGIADRLDKIWGADEQSGSKVYQRIGEVLDKVVREPMLAKDAGVSLVCDLREFTQLPAFVLIISTKDRRKMVSGVQKAIAGLSDRYFVESCRSKGWALTVVGVEEGTELNIATYRNTLLVSNSPRLYDEVVRTASGRAENLASDPEFADAKARVEEGGDLFFFTRPRMLVAGAPVDKALSMMWGGQTVWALRKATASVRGGRALAATMRFAQGLRVDSCTVSAHESPVVAEAFKVPAGPFKAGRYLSPDLFLVYSYRMSIIDFRRYLDFEHRELLGAFRQDYAELRGLVGPGVTKEVLEALGPEVTVGVGSDETTAAPVLVLLMEVKNRPKVQRFVDDAIDKALAEMRKVSARAKESASRRDREDRENEPVPDAKPVVYVRKDESFRGTMVRAMEVPAEARVAGQGRERAYAFVGDFFVFSTSVSAVKNVVAAFRPGGEGSSKDSAYARAMDGLPVSCHQKVFLDMHRATDVVKKLLDSYVDANVEIEQERKPHVKKLCAQVMDAFRIVQSYGATTARVGDERRRSAQVIISKP